jgi:hypothetical protein
MLDSEHIAPLLASRPVRVRPISIEKNPRWRTPGRAKVAQESLIKASKIPYTIVRATQFFEFVGAIADSGTDGGTVRVPPLGCSLSRRMTSRPSWPTSPRQNR